MWYKYFFFQIIFCDLLKRGGGRNTKPSLSNLFFDRSPVSSSHSLGQRQLHIKAVIALKNKIALCSWREPRTTCLLSCGEVELLQALEKLRFSQIDEALPCAELMT